MKDEIWIKRYHVKGLAWLDVDFFNQEVREGISKVTKLNVDFVIFLCILQAELNYFTIETIKKNTEVLAYEG